MSESLQEILIKKESLFGAQNYSPLSVVLEMYLKEKNKLEKLSEVALYKKLEEIYREKSANAEEINALMLKLDESIRGLKPSEKKRVFIDQNKDCDLYCGTHHSAHVEMTCCKNKNICFKCLLRWLKKRCSVAFAVDKTMF